jgi:hypothetical protein
MKKSEKSLKNDHCSKNNEFCDEKDSGSDKKHIFRQLRHHRRCIDRKKFEKRKKKFAPFWTSRGGGHVTTLPPISRARGGNQINASVILNRTPLGTRT